MGYTYSPSVYVVGTHSKTKACHLGTRSAAASFITGILARGTSWTTVAPVFGDRRSMGGVVSLMRVTPRLALVVITGSPTSTILNIVWIVLVLPVQCVDRFKPHHFILQLETFLQGSDELNEGVSGSFHTGYWLLNPFVSQYGLPYVTGFMLIIAETVR